MSTDKCRIGFLSTANIGGKNRRAIQLSPNGVVYAVASRSLQKAQEWSQTHTDGKAKAYGSYEDLIADPAVDAVYVPLPCAMHREWCLKIAAAGKAVLVEKPTAISTSELEEIIAACKANNVQFMDGTMFVHHARMEKMKAVIDDESSFGKMVRMSSAFSFFSDDEWLSTNIRGKKELEPFGCLGDLGWYNIRFALWAMNWSLPLSVRSSATAWSPLGAPIDVTAQLHFAPSKGASSAAPAPVQMLFDCSFNTAFRQWVEIAGTKSTLSLNDFVLSRNHHSCEYIVLQNPDLDSLHSNVLGSKTTVEIKDCNQEAVMWEKFASLVLKKEFDPFWPRIALLTQCVLDACMESITKGGVEVAVKPPALQL